ncbi:transposase [Bradyrhizobium japonicum]
MPECLDDWVADDNPVRVIDAFVAALDLAELGFGGVEPAGTGRPSYHPAALLGLYIYGYLNRVHSSRRLEREAGRNVEVMWLLARLAPDHKTIADFRKNNGPGIKKVCARFVEVCRKMGLLATASVAIDGSKFKAVNNRDKNFTRGKVERRRTQLEESVARYLAQLDTTDRQEPSETLELKKTRIEERLENLTVEMAKLAAIEKQGVLASPDQQISFTDPDSRSMATSGRGSGVVGYNVQTAVDTESHLIVAHEVTTSGSDRSQLANKARQAKVHAEPTTPYQAMGVRGRSRTRSGAARQESKRHAHTPRDRRASVRHTEDAHGRDALLVRDAAESCDRDGAVPFSHFALRELYAVAAYGTVGHSSPPIAGWLRFSL